MFQDYELIATDLAHNISADNKPLDIKRADEALKRSAFWDKFKTLPNGYETQLTKEFDESGFNPSGGEKQKIALARVLYADSDIIILDEPSGALDPIAEYTLNKTVTELSSDKTVILFLTGFPQPALPIKFICWQTVKLLKAALTKSL